MSSLSDVFQSIDSPALLDSVLNNNDISAVNSCNEESKLVIKRKLNEVLGNVEITNNAKSRRRLKRYMESIDVAEDAGHPSATAHSVDEDKITNKRIKRDITPGPSAIPATPIVPVDLHTSLSMLEGCQSMKDVQTAMDSMVLPEPLNLDSGPLAALHGPLKAALQHLMTVDGITNKVLRRRMTRLIFVLSRPEDQAEQTRKHKEAAAKAAQAAKEATAAAAAVIAAQQQQRKQDRPSTDVAGTSTSSSASGTAADFTLPANACSLKECLHELQQADSMEEKEAIITRTTSHASLNSLVPLQTKKELGVALAELVAQEAVGAKLRRRIKRLQEQVDTACKLDEDAARSSTVTTAGTGAGSCASDSSGVSRMPTRRTGSDAAATPVLDTITSVSETAKTTVATEEVAVGAAHSEVLALPEVPMPLEATILKVQQAKSGQQLEVALADVKPLSGNMRSRRTLKRAIERVLASGEAAAADADADAEPEKEGGIVLNSKVRRRVARVLDMLAPDAARKSLEELRQCKEKAAKKETALAAKEAAAEQSKRVPYVLFIGQLNYSATADELRSFLVAKGIEGEIKIRLLTFRDSGESRGSAFVEVEGAREMHKCVALHMTSFQGRMLNIEKSCGGSNRETRAVKIEQKREEQKAKVREPIDRLLVEHGIDVENMGVDLKVAVYNCAPAVVSDALKRYAAIPESDRKWSTLHQLITRLSTRSKAKTKRLQQQRSNDSSGDNDCGSSDDDNDASRAGIDNKAALFSAAVVHSDGLEI